MSEREGIIDPAAESAIIERQLIAPGFTSIREVRHARRAVFRKWIVGTRWPTDANLDQLKQIESTRKLSAKELLTLRALEALQGTNRKDHNFAARLLKMMEEQNQKDDLASDASEAFTDPTLPTEGGSLTINVQQNNVVAGSVTPNEELKNLIASALAREPDRNPPLNGNGSNGHH